MKNVDEHGSIVVYGQKQASALDGVAVDGDPGAPELVGVVIPELRDAAFGLEAEGWLLGVDSVDIALTLLLVSGGAAAVRGGGGAEEEDKAES